MIKCLNCGNQGHTGWLYLECIKAPSPPAMHNMIRPASNLSGTLCLYCMWVFFPGQKIVGRGFIRMANPAPGKQRIGPSLGSAINSGDGIKQCPSMHIWTSYTFSKPSKHQFFAGMSTRCDIQSFLQETTQSATLDLPEAPRIHLARERTFLTLIGMYGPLPEGTIELVVENKSKLLKDLLQFLL